MNPRLLLLLTSLSLFSSLPAQDLRLELTLGYPES